MKHEPMPVVTACAGRDLHILRHAIRGLRTHLACGRIHVITAQQHLVEIEAVGGDLEVSDEDQVMPGMTLEALRRLKLPGFPRGAGWYFQQLLKLDAAARDPAGEYCLIWDADTVLLRPMNLFDDEGRVYFTVADEFHPPYFETYEQLLGEPAQREFSFITQHIVVHRPTLRMMLAAIDRHCPGNDGWAWKIMRNLRGAGTNCFSEYETYGHFVKARFPDRAAFRRLPWTRDGTRLASFHPTEEELARLAQDYAFAAFEASQVPWRRAARWVRATLPI